MLNMGRKTVLYGVHHFLIHPIYLALAWKKLYGPIRDPRLWVAFAVHDLGYFTTNVTELDSPEGERHVEFGAHLMHRLFGPQWGDFTRFHSRFYAKQAGAHFSRLCVADKLAPTLEPAWLYRLRARATGEIWEYTWHYCYGKYRTEQGQITDLPLSEEDFRRRRLTPAVAAAMNEWHRTTMAFLSEWAYTHRDLATPEPSALHIQGAES